MAGSFTLPTVLANLAAGNEALSLIDGDFNAVANPLLALGTFSNYYADTGAANAYVITVSSPQTVAQTAGLSIQFLATNVNTGASTLQINALAVKNITHLDGSALVAGDIPAAGLVTVIYDGTQYQLQSKGKASALDGVTSLTGVAGTNTITATAAPTFAAYATGQKFAFVPAATNTAATTLNIGGLGVKSIFWNAAACNGGEIRSGVPCIVFYDGTQFNLIAQGGALNSIAAGAVGGPSVTFSSDTTSGLFRPGANIVAMSISGTEAWRTTASGYFKASNNGTYANSGSQHEFTTNANDYGLYVTNTSATLSQAVNGINMFFSGATPNNTTSIFFRGHDASAVRHELRSNGGYANFSANNVNLSDVTVKESFEPLETSWDKVKGIRASIRYFRYSDATNKSEESSWCCSPMAQDVQLHYPEYVVPFNDKGQLGVREQPLLWELIGNLIDEVAALKAKAGAA